MRLREMEEHYPTQRHCYELLDDLVWDFEPTCPHCESKDVLYTKPNYYNSKDGYKCGRCSKTYSVTKNTMFQDTKVPLVKWFTAIHILKTFKRLPSGRRLADLVDVSQVAAIRMKTRILIDLESDRVNSLANQIYQYNRRHERFWF